MLTPTLQRRVTGPYCKHGTHGTVCVTYVSLAGPAHQKDSHLNDAGAALPVTKPGLQLIPLLQEECMTCGSNSQAVSCIAWRRVEHCC